MLDAVILVSQVSIHLWNEFMCVMCDMATQVRGRTGRPLPQAETIPLEHLTLEANLTSSYEALKMHLNSLLQFIEAS
jgi:hypothetical protein